MNSFRIDSSYKPQGDQPAAIEKLLIGLSRNYRFQVLLGVTGSGKTYTVAKVIEGYGLPAVVMAPNKALAAQLCNEFKELFPGNAVEFFISFYDYYQPEAYLPGTDTYIEKDTSINEEIEKLRYSATDAILSRTDVIIVASVSCIYNLGSPMEYSDRRVILRHGETFYMDDLISRLVGMQYERNDFSFERGTFRVKGENLDIFPAYEDYGFRISYFEDDVDQIFKMDPLTGEVLDRRDDLIISPATHFITSDENLKLAIRDIEVELEQRLEELKKEGKLLEAQRLEMRTNYDLEMLREIGYCKGIENYSRHLSRKRPGETPSTLFDYFKGEFLTLIDESHISIPQIIGMYEGDRSRKQTLVDYGFRLPSALDNRPLKFDEFLARVNKVMFVSATPGDFEMGKSHQIVEQIIRPTGLIDPLVLVRPTKGQIDDLYDEIVKRVNCDKRVLVTTLTKKMAEDLTEYFIDLGVKARYMHSEIDVLERIEIIRGLRSGDFDVLVGINLLREGLDLPEVSLVAILDADKEGYLRSERSLIQTIGRAARNINGQVIMYADKITNSMSRAISETNRRRKIQSEYNELHGIEPRSISKKISDLLMATRIGETQERYGKKHRKHKFELRFESKELPGLIQALEDEMRTAADELRYEYAAQLRDRIRELKGLPLK